MIASETQNLAATAVIVEFWVSTHIGIWFEPQKRDTTETTGYHGRQGEITGDYGRPQRPVPNLNDVAGDMTQIR